MKFTAHLLHHRKPIRIEVEAADLRAAERVARRVGMLIGAVVVSVERRAD